MLLIGLLLTACDLFPRDVGGLGQPCDNNARCSEGLVCNLAIARCEALKMDGDHEADLDADAERDSAGEWDADLDESTETEIETDAEYEAEYETENEAEPENEVFPEIEAEGNEDADSDPDLHEQEMEHTDSDVVMVDGDDLDVESEAENEGEVETETEKEEAELDVDSRPPLPHFVSIEAGSFDIGSPPNELGRDAAGETQHPVNLTYAFEISAYETTQGELYSLLGYNISRFVSCGKDCPADNVTWTETLKAANELSLRRGYPPCFDCTGRAPDFVCSLKPIYAKPQDCPGYRLPTEAEWEYAARAGASTPYNNGEMLEPDGGCLTVDANLDAIGWYCGNNAVSYSGCYKPTDQEGCMGTHPVGQKQANAWGLFDVSGNVNEWAWDYYKEYAMGVATDPTGPLSPSNPAYPSRVIRGGDWGMSTTGCRMAWRRQSHPYYSYSTGFRLARSLNLVVDGDLDLEETDSDSQTDSFSCKDGLCSDSATGMYWQESATSEINYSRDYCEHQNDHGSGWRLPNILELRTLIHDCPRTQAGGICYAQEACPYCGSVAVEWPYWASCASTDSDTMCRPTSCSSTAATGCYWPEGLKGTCGTFWSSSEPSGCQDINGNYSDGWVWTVDFNSASVFMSMGTNGAKARIRCVRLGPPNDVNPICLHTLCDKVSSTGLTKCYDNNTVIPCPGLAGAESCGTTDFCGQDAQYPVSAPTYICRNAAGQVESCQNLPVSSENEVVEEPESGLVWQRLGVSQMYWVAARNYCETLSYGGYDDWRLPTPHDFIRLLKDGVENPYTTGMIDSVAFPGWGSNASFWTSAREDSYWGSGSAYSVNFSSGDLGRGDIERDQLGVRCVRGGKKTTDVVADKRYTSMSIGNDTVVFDAVSGLTWSARSSSSLGWKEALAHCESLDYGQQKDWRLANKKELLSLADFGANPASAFPASNIDKELWSSSSDSKTASNAWYISGLFTTYRAGKSYKYYALCVRTGLITSDGDADSDTPDTADADTSDTPACTDGPCCHGGVKVTIGQPCLSGQDSLPCTDDVCDAAGTCTHPLKAENTSCNDGVFCNGTDTCDAFGVCRHAGDPCTSGDLCNNSCNETDKDCFSTPLISCRAAAGECDQAALCDGAGACPANLNAGDGSGCGTMDQCLAGVCVDCTNDTGCADLPDDGLECSAPACNTTTHTCEQDLSAHFTQACGSHVSTTCDQPDSCDASGVCQTNYASSSTGCNDGNACTQTDTCKDGTCQGANPVACKALDSCHIPGSCDTQNGTCSHPVGNEGTVCNDDSDKCNGVSTCVAGSCEQTTAPVVCTIPRQVCQSWNGQCVCDSSSSLSHGVCVSYGYKLIDTGTFYMGSVSEDGHVTNETTHSVVIGYRFEMSRTEVTQSEWASFFPGTAPSWFGPKGEGADCGDHCPVERVNWFEALAYANQLSTSKGLAPCYILEYCAGTIGGGCLTNETSCMANTYACTHASLNGVSKPQECEGFRLPTEAEWEYAARAGSMMAYHDNITSSASHLYCEVPFHLTDIAWYCGNASSTIHEVANRMGNTWGVYDMSGNVSEWVWDWYDSEPGTLEQTDPIGPEYGNYRVQRGGAFNSSAQQCRSAYRGYREAETRSNDLGFRVVRTLK